MKLTDAALMNLKKDFAIDRLEGRVHDLESEKKELLARIDELVKVNKELTEAAEAINSQEQEQ